MNGLIPAIRPAVRALVPESVRAAVREEVYYRANTAALRRAKPPAALKPGLHLAGLIEEPTGVGSAARLLARGCVEAHIPLSVTPLRSETGGHFPVPEWEGYFTDAPEKETNLLVFNADCAGSLISRLGAEKLAGRRNIAHWSWELPVFPDKWPRAFRYFDEIWTISEFCRAAIAERTELPVVTIPYGIAPAPDLSLTRSDFGLPEGRVLYLTMFDARSISARKNPMAAVRAYCRAFPADNGHTALVIKGGSGAEAERELASLRRETGGRADILCLAGAYTKPRIDALLALCDVFVSLHRAEGFGLPIAEAMALGRAVLVTAWSGNMDYCRADNAVLIPYTLEKVGTLAAPPYDAWQEWAEPDIDAAAEGMRALASEEALRRSIGERAAALIGEYYSPLRCGEAIGKRL